MKKLLVLIAVLFEVSIVSYGQLEDLPTEPSERDWEVAPNIISGGYNDQEGPYIYKLFNVYSCPTLLFDYSRYYVNYMQAITNIGYGDFQHHGGGNLISKDETGEITKDDDETWAVSYGLSYMGTDPSQPTEYTGAHGPAYVYKKEAIQSMSIAFSSSSYTAQEGQKLSVNVFVVGGSGYFYGKTVKPVFLSTVGKLSYEGTCYEPVTTSISTVVRDKVTGQECVASADIVITEKSDDNNNSGSSGSSGSSSDPGGTASDPGSSSGDGGDTGSDTGTSVGSGDTGDTGGDDGGSAVDPGSSDDDPITEPDDSSSDDETDDGSDDDSGTDSTTTAPGSSDNTDSPADTSNADNSDSTSDTSDTSDLSGDDDAVVVVPDGTDPADTSGGSDIADDSDNSDTSDTVIISDTTEEDEPTVIVINDSNSSDSDKIVVTDDGVVTVKPDNYDLAVLMSMFGAMTALSGSATAPADTPMAVQEARGGKDHE